jgi:hypothetical protein
VAGAREEGDMAALIAQRDALLALV